MQSKRLVIIDGYSLLYRAFFATRYLSTSDGRPTNALYGFIGMLFCCWRMLRSDVIAVAALPARAADVSARRAPVVQGHAARDPRRAEGPASRSSNLIETLVVPSVEVTGFEADDVVGTISRLAEENGYDTTIVTGDLDPVTRWTTACRF